MLEIIKSYSTGKFPEQYIPTIFDTYSLKMVVDSQEVNVGLWDTAGQEEFAKIRPMSYPNTNICLIIFSIDSPESFDNAIKKVLLLYMKVVSRNQRKHSKSYYSISWK